MSIKIGSFEMKGRINNPGSMLSAALLLLLLQACGPSINTAISQTYPAIDYNRPIVVYELEDTVPDGNKIIGTVHIGESGFTTRCSYNYVLEQAKLEARKSGGSAIKITEHKRPNAWSSCHRIKANILRTAN